MGCKVGINTQKLEFNTPILIVGPDTAIKDDPGFTVLLLEEKLPLDMTLK